MNLLDLLANPLSDTGIGHEGKMLPNQPFTKDLYTGGDHDTALYNVLSAYAQEYSPERFKLKPFNEQMASAPMNIAVIGMVAMMLQAKRILEIGTYIGHTTMQLSRLVGPGGSVHTIEFGQEFANIAEANFHRNEIDNIHLFHGDAAHIMKMLVAGYDLIFIDGGKENYPDYMVQSERLLSRRGAIIVDDVFFHGDALNKHPQTQKGRGCKRVLDRYRDRTDWEKLLLPIGNGMLILFRT